MIESPSVELNMQDLVDTLKGVIERSWNGMDEPPLHSSAGKEQLDPETTVGITVTLQNSQIAFESRNNSISLGSSTLADPNGTLLTDQNADFTTDNVNVGDIIINFTDKSLAVVIEVLSSTQIKHYKLADGTDNDWDVPDNYKIFHVAQCEITGGNLVAVDEGGIAISPISPTAFTQVVKASSSSATLADLAAIQYASFNGGVTIDTIAGKSGAAYPKGTQQEPVNNLVDAKVIANERGFDKLYIVGNITFGATDNIDKFMVIGENPYFSTVTFVNGCSAEGAHFEQATLQGYVEGTICAICCTIIDLAVFKGVAKQCLLKGTIVLSGGIDETVHFLNCWSAMPGSGTPIIDMGGDGPSLNARQIAGGFVLKNKTGNSGITIDFVSGQLKIESTVTAGNIVVRGIGKITKNEGLATIENYALVNPETISDQVWDEITGEHMISGSTADFLSKIKEIETGRWKMENNKMIFYGEDGITPIITFNLYDKNAQPAMENIIERTPS